MSSSAGQRLTRALQHRNFRLFFGGHGDPAVLVDLIAELQARAETQLAELREIERGVDAEEDVFGYLTLLHGIEDAESTVRWCGVALQVLRQHSTVATR